MVEQRDFNIPDELSDVAFLVEDKKIYANRAFLGTLSPMFKNMLAKDFAESKMPEISLVGPHGTELKHDEFLELMKVVHLEEDVTAASYENLLNLADYFDIKAVFRLADNLLALQDTEHALVPLIKKVIAVDKYDNKLAETKEMVMTAFTEISDVRDLMEMAEFWTLSAETRADLLQPVVASSSYDDFTLKTFTCRLCPVYAKYHSYNQKYRDSYIEKNRASAYCTYCGNWSFCL